MPAQRWTDDEIIVLEKSIQEGLSPESIARNLHRTASAVHAKIKALQSRRRMAEGSLRGSVWMSMEFFQHVKL